VNGHEAASGRTDCPQPARQIERWRGGHDRSLAAPREGHHRRRRQRQHFGAISRHVDELVGITRPSTAATPEGDRAVEGPAGPQRWGAPWSRRAPRPPQTYQTDRSVAAVTYGLTQCGQGSNRSCRKSGRFLVTIAGPLRYLRALDEARPDVTRLSGWQSLMYRAWGAQHGR
jgi:hypothetical protein